MTTIRAMTVVPWAIPVAAPITTAHGVLITRRGFLVQLEADRGLQGVGDAAPHPAAPPCTLRATLTSLVEAASWLVGADLSQVSALLERAATLVPATASGIDIALHDLLGRATGQSVAELLGGSVRTTIEASALVVGDEPADCATRAAAAATRGFSAAKVKVGAAVTRGIERVRAVHAAAPGLSLRADANGAWDPETALRAAAALAPFALEWLEQPAPPDDLAALAHIRRASHIPVAADEAVTGPDAIARLADARAADIVVLKLVQVGGLARGRACAEMAARCGLDVTVTTAFDTGVGTAAALHLAASVPGPLRACGVATGHVLAGDVLQSPIPNAPRMAPPAGPGLGIALDPAAVARWRVEEPA